MGGETSVWVSYMSFSHPLLVFPVPVEAANRTLSSFHCIIAFSDIANDVRHYGLGKAVSTDARTVESPIKLARIEGCHRVHVDPYH